MYKVYFISPSLKVGGIERSLVTLANYLVSRGHQITFISCLGGDHFYSLEDKVELIEPNFRYTGGGLNKLFFYPRLIYFIRRVVKKNKPDVILTFGDLFSPLVLLALLGMAFNIFISERTSPDYRFKFPIQMLKQWLYPFSAGFIAQTKRAADYKRQKFGNKLNIRIIPNAVRELKVKEGCRKKIILYVGRFAWEKGPSRLIEAFSEIKDRQGWHLLMAGSGPLLKSIKELAIQRGIEKEVTFTGNVNNIDDLYSKASIYVLPSLLEGFPNSLCEAMAAGLPVVCFDSIPWEEILEPGKSGIVVEDVRGLSKALNQLINDADLRQSLGSNAILIKERLSLERIGSLVEDFIFS